MPILPWWSEHGKELRRPCLVAAHHPDRVVRPTACRQQLESGGAQLGGGNPMHDQVRAHPICQETADRRRAFGIERTEHRHPNQGHSVERPALLGAVGVPDDLRNCVRTAPQDDDMRHGFVAQPASLLDSVTEVSHRASVSPATDSVAAGSRQQRGMDRPRGSRQRRSSLRYSVATAGPQVGHRHRTVRSAAR